MANNNVPGKAAEATIIVNGKECKLGVTKKKKKSPVDEDKQNADPLTKLGFGICAYRDIVKAMAWSFVLFSLFMIPQFKIYASGTAYANLSESMQSNENRMLGNMGYSSVSCLSMPVEIGSYVYSCNYGVIGEVLSFGITNVGDGNSQD